MAVLEYSQPVLYSHFPSRGAIVAAVALEGFEELAAHLRTARTSTPNDALRALAEAYLTEIAWSALHGLATLSRAGRLRPDCQQQRIDMLADQIVGSIAPSGKSA